MTKEVDYYDELMRAVKDSEDLEGLLGKASHPAGPVHDKAEKELREKVYEFYKTVNPAIASVGADKLTGEDIERGVKEMQELYKHNPGNVLYNNRDDIIRNISGENLETLARSQVIAGSSDKDDLEVIRRYSTIGQLKSFKKKLEDEEPLTEDEGELRKKFVDTGLKQYIDEEKNKAIAREKERQEGLNYNDKRLQELIGSVASTAAQISLRDENTQKEMVKKFGVEGISKEIKETEKAYEEITENRYDVQRAVRNTVYKLASEKDPGKFRIGLDAVTNPSGLDKKYLKAA